MNIKIKSVKIYGLCSKHGGYIRDKYRKKIKDEDIECIECNW